MVDPVALAAEIISDLALAADAIAKVKANIAAGTGIINATDLADAKAKLAAIQVQATEADAAFDAAVAAAGA